MRRELLLIGEMIDAAEQAQALVSGVDLDTLTSDRQRRDALLWNFTVLGEAAAQLDAGVKERFPEIPWAQPARLATGSSTATDRSTSRSCTPPPPTCSRSSPISSARLSRRSKQSPSSPTLRATDA